MYNTNAQDKNQIPHLRKRRIKKDEIAGNLRDSMAINVWSIEKDRDPMPITFSFDAICEMNAELQNRINKIKQETLSFMQDPSKFNSKYNSERLSPGHKVSVVHSSEDNFIFIQHNPNKLIETLDNTLHALDINPIWPFIDVKLTRKVEYSLSLHQHFVHSLSLRETCCCVLLSCFVVLLFFFFS